MALDFINVNWLGVFASAIVGNIFMMMWYGPLLGNLWLKHMGFDPDEIKKGMADKKGMRIRFAIAFLSQIIVSYFLAMFMEAFNAYTFGHIIGFGFLLWLPLIAVIFFNSVLWENKNIPVYTINVTGRLANIWVLSTIYFVIKHFAA